MAKEHKRGFFARMFKKNTEFKSPYTVMDAARHGNMKTKISFFIMGFGNMAYHQWIKGLLFLLVEIAFIAFMVLFGGHCLAMLPGLGDVAQGEVWNEAKGIYEYTAGDDSLLILLYGIATIFIIVGFWIIWCGTVKSAYKAQIMYEGGKKLPTFKEDIADLFDKKMHYTLLTLPVIGIIIFTVLPLVFMISMAFTNYSVIGNHLVLFDWVGFRNFGEVLNFGSEIGSQFWAVLAWTLTWAVCATFSNYILGMILALIINRKDTKGKTFWRFCFILSIAVPQFVSLLIMRQMLNEQGAINTLLLNWGWISSPLPFWTNAAWARVTVIVINCWLGIPYTILQVTGILESIPGDLYEAAKIDGANAVTTFFKITLPYMLFVTTPYLITQFTGNVNNFNVIYLLSRGDPTQVGHTAGDTDLLVTWLYKLTIDRNLYNTGAVIGIFTFIVLAIVSLVTYRTSGSYKNEEGFM